MKVFSFCGIIISFQQELIILDSPGLPVQYYIIRKEEEIKSFITVIVNKQTGPPDINAIWKLIIVPKFSFSGTNLVVWNEDIMSINDNNFEFHYCFTFTEVQVKMKYFIE